MKIIKITKEMDYKQTGNWIQENREKLFNEKEKIVIDFSGICFIHSNMTGFIINLIMTRKKKNFETKIIATSESLNNQDFKAIGGLI